MAPKKDDAAAILMLLMMTPKKQVCKGKGFKGGTTPTPTPTPLQLESELVLARVQPSLEARLAAARFSELKE
eukprot:scaffold43921_cov161-Skeletonema_marinoi.AAC.1